MAVVTLITNSDNCSAMQKIMEKLFPESRKQFFLCIFGSIQTSGAENPKKCLLCSL